MAARSTARSFTPWLAALSSGGDGRGLGGRGMQLVDQRWFRRRRVDIELVLQRLVERRGLQQLRQQQLRLELELGLEQLGVR